MKYDRREALEIGKMLVSLMQNDRHFCIENSAEYGLVINSTRYLESSLYEALRNEYLQMMGYNTGNIKLSPVAYEQLCQEADLGGQTVDEVAIRKLRF